MTSVTAKDFLTSRKLSRFLSEKGINVSYRTILRYVREGFIPEDFYVVQRHGKRKFYYFKPEVVDFLVKKLSEE